MAHSILSVVSSPDFPQLLRSAIDRAVTRTLERIAESNLSCCSYESPESRVGACDGLPCVQKATVHHLQAEQEYCLRHFEEVRRG